MPEEGDGRELIERFLAHLAGERGYSPATVAAYRSDLGSIEKRTGPLDGLTSAALVGYLLVEKEAGRAASTIRRRLAALRSFANFAAAEGLFDRPLGDLTLPRHAEPLPKPLRPEEIEALLAAAARRLERAEDKADSVYKRLSPTQRALRDLALLELLYASGLRVSEALSVEWTQLDLRAGYVRITGKGGLQRVVPVGETALRALTRYRDALGQPKRADPVFCSRPGSALKRNRVNRLLAGLAAEAGLDIASGPHRLRHSFATHLLAGGASVRLVKELLGHSRLTETQRYTRVEVSRLERAHRESHPRSRRKG
ncbi:MAG TPA: tyrosine-type recombinase/integrase [bacterium]|nr:tyrosine-type recombinase/integrase [bacterium]